MEHIMNFELFENVNQNELTLGRAFLYKKGECEMVVKYTGKSGGKHKFERISGPCTKENVSLSMTQAKQYIRRIPSDGKGYF